MSKQYSFYVDGADKELLSNPQIFRHIRQNLDLRASGLDVTEIKPANAREIRDVYRLSYEPSSRIRGRMTKEEVGNLAEILFGVGGVSLAVIYEGQVIMTRTNGGQN